MASADLRASAALAKGSLPFSASLTSPETLNPRSTTSRPCASTKRVPSTVTNGAAGGCRVGVDPRTGDAVERRIEGEDGEGDRSEPCAHRASRIRKIEDSESEK